MSEHIEWQELHELLKELAQKEYGDKYGEQIFWYFQDVIDDSCKLDVLEEENERLNNIINELEQWFEDMNIESLATFDDYDIGQYNAYKKVINKLQELKGDGSNEIVK